MVSDVSRWPEILTTVDEVELIGEPDTVGVGSRFRVRQPGLATAVYVVTKWQEGHGFTWEAQSVGVHTIATHSITPSETGSRLKLSIDWTGAISGLVRLIYGRRAQRMVTIEADTFVRLAASG